jgi:hypothetical protein
VTLARPAPADAHFSLAIGLPGFGLVVHEPVPPPVYYGRAYYAPVVVRRPCHFGRGHWHGHRRWY